MKKSYEGLELRVIKLIELDILTLSLDNDGVDEDNWELPESSAR